MRINLEALEQSAAGEFRNQKEPVLPTMGINCGVTQRFGFIKEVDRRINLVDAEVEPMIWDDNEWQPLHDAQRLAWNATERIVALFKGWRAGGTSLGPFWINREIKRRGAGLYAVIVRDSPMLESAVLPMLKGVFTEPYWKYSGARGGSFTMTPAGELAYFGARQRAATRIITRHALDPKAIESWGAKAIWMDECGQMANSIWEAVQARAMTHQARFFMTSRPYEHNWYVTEIWAKCMECLSGNPDEGEWTRRADAPDDIVCINFPTNANPSPGNQIEYARQKLILMPWVFRMKFDGIPTRPAGQVYTSFKSIAVSGRPSNVVKFSEFFPHGLPDEWPVWVGIDFGKRNTAIVLIAEEMEMDLFGGWQKRENPRFCAFKAYHPGVQRTPVGHLRESFRGLGEDYQFQDPDTGELCEGFRLTKSQVTAFGGALGEQDSRDLYALSGLTVCEPVFSGSGSVEAQIQTVWSAFEAGRLFVCEHLVELITDIQTFSMELDKDTNEATEKLKDEVKFHLLAALRYVVCSMLPSEIEVRPMSALEASAPQMALPEEMG